MNDTPAGPAQSPWWQPDRLAERLPRLRARNAIAAATRTWFAAQGFEEVETPALQVSPGMEVHLQAFATELREPFEADAKRRLYLHTSPEFAMKKLLVAGMPRIFQLARTWRNAERSSAHHPEFTMLEWYRAHDGWRSVAADCEALVREVQATVRPDYGPLLRRGEITCDPFRRWAYLSVAEAFDRYCGFDLLATASDSRALAKQAHGLGIATDQGDAWDDMFFRIFLDRIEPQLGVGVPTVLYDWPLSMAALARPSPADGRVAERFEVFACGMELANGFGELTDPVEQRRRFEADMARKHDVHGEAWPVDEDFLAALEHGMPDSAGIALGFDRLAMLCTGATSIEDVLWAPVVTAC